MKTANQRLADEVARFERNMVRHGYYVYRCGECGRVYGRYIEERPVVWCGKCGSCEVKHVMTVEPGNMIVAMMNKGKAGGG